MEAKERLTDRFVREQMERWKGREAKTGKPPEYAFTVVTVCMEPGSGGRIIAEQVAEQLGYDCFHREIVHEISESTHMSASVIDSLEKDRFTGMEDFLSSLVKQKYLYPGTYLRHLMKVVAAIARHEQAVIVGRGANFILPKEKRFSVRVIAPLETRVKNVARTYQTSLEEAEKRVIRRESRRSAFIRQSFHADISDPLHYDMVLNTGQMDIATATAAVVGAVTAGGPVE